MIAIDEPQGTSDSHRLRHRRLGGGTGVAGRWSVARSWEFSPSTRIARNSPFFDGELAEPSGRKIAAN